MYLVRIISLFCVLNVIVGKIKGKGSKSLHLVLLPVHSIHEKNIYIRFKQEMRDS